MSLQITEHFTDAEVEHSHEAIRRSIDNFLPDDLRANAQRVASLCLEPLRAYLKTPISPTSWYRCPELDAAIRGDDTLSKFRAGKWTPTSQHCLAAAADLRIPGVTLYKVAEFLRKNTQFDQLIYEAGWIHVSVSTRPGLSDGRRDCLVWDPKAPRNTQYQRVDDFSLGSVAHAKLMARRGE